MEHTQSSALSRALTVPVCTALTQVWLCINSVLPQKEGDVHKNIKINILFILSVIELLKDSCWYCLIMYFYFPCKFFVFEPYTSLQTSLFRYINGHTFKKTDKKLMHNNVCWVQSTKNPMESCDTIYLGLKWEALS